jgi:hypothetical protein
MLALGIFVVAGFALIGLLAVGLQSSTDSKQQLQAATIAEFLCSTRRAAPTVSFTGSSSLQPNFPLPVLSTSVLLTTSLATPIGLTWDGLKAPSVTDPTARFGLVYSIAAPSGYTAPVSPATASAAPGAATLYLYIYWPAGATPTAASTSHYELTTTIPLP